MTLPEIKRIEMLKGHAATVYRFNSFEGVINIITKSPQEMKGTTLQFGVGEFGAIILTTRRKRASTDSRFQLRTHNSELPGS